MLELATSRLVTLTLNPAIDLSGEVDHLRPAHKLRCRNERRDPGGGGINVARVLARLGAGPLAVFPAAGAAGALLERMVSGEGVACVTVPVAGETRQNVTIDDSASGQQYRFVFAGVPLPEADTEHCLATALALVGEGSWLIASGSLAPNMPPDTYRRLGRRVKEAGGKFVLDASGAPMSEALGEVHLLKLSEKELQEVSAQPVSERGACVAAARRLLARGPHIIAISRGEKGALLVTRDQALVAAAVDIKPHSTVGAGDSFLAALVWDLSRGRTEAEALASAVAAGTAALMEPGTELAQPDVIAQLKPRVTVESLAAAAGGKIMKEAG